MYLIACENAHLHPSLHAADNLCSRHKSWSIQYLKSSPIFLCFVFLCLWQGENIFIFSWREWTYFLLSFCDFFFLSESFFMISSWFSSYLGIKQSCLYPVLAEFFLVTFIYNILKYKYVSFLLCEKLRWEVVWILQGILSSFLCRAHSLLIFAISFISLHINS